MSTNNNWYIPRRNVVGLREYCENFRESGEPKGRLWGLLQLGDKLFGPFYGELLSDLAGKDEGQIEAHILNTKLRRPSPGDVVPGNVDSICFVDCNYEMYPEEYGANQLRSPSYKCDKWDWPNYLALRVARLGRHVQFNVPLDYWGQLIAVKSRPEFCSQQILRAAGLAP